MALRRVLVTGLVLSFWPLAAFAQDDLLAPLTPDPDTKADAKPKSKPKPKRRPKVQHVKPPAPPPDEAIAPLIPQKTELVVTVEGGVKGATVFLDGKELGPVTAAPLDVTPGDHALVVKRMGYTDFTQTVTLKPGQRSEIAATLEASAGVISVASDISGSEVVVDGRPLGVAPVRDVFVSPGSHEIVVKREGFENDISKVMVKAGKTYTVNAHLRPEKPAAVASNDSPTQTPQPQLTPRASDTAPVAPQEEVAQSSPVYGRWYFWAGVAAVVAGGVAVGVLASSSSGRANPAEICSPAVCAGVINGLVRF